MEQPRPIVERKLSELREQVLRMGGLAESILEKSIRSISPPGPALADEVLEDDLAIDRLDIEIDRGVLALLALGAPLAQDLRETIAIKTAALDLERVGDLARNISESAIRLEEEKALQLPPDLQTLAAATRRILSSALTAFADKNADRARQVVEADDQIDADEARVIQDAKQAMRRHPEHAAAYVEFVLIAKSLERVGDHATNIAEDVVMTTQSLNLKHAKKLATESVPQRDPGEHYEQTHPCR